MRLNTTVAPSLFEWPFSMWTWISRFPLGFLPLLDPEENLSGERLLKAGCPSCHPADSVRSNHKALNLTSVLALCYLHPPDS